MDEPHSMTITEQLEVAFQRLLRIQAQSTARLTIEERQQQARLWLGVWRRLVDALDDDFDPADVPYLNLVPEGTGLRSGVAASEIDDPELRAAYEAAIVENQRKADYYREQVELRQFAELFVPQAELVITAMYAGLPHLLHELEELLIESGIDAGTRDTLMRKVATK
ncbi:MAG TPA: hypothetical protein VGE04_19955 [Chloroflexia bacterium]|jgi:hypothetical protein